jgi:hypothetical protein
MTTAKHIYLNSERGLADHLPAITAQSTVSHAHFASVGDCVRYVQSIPAADCWNDFFFDNSDSARDLVSVTGPEACGLALNGWHDGAARVARLRDTIAATQPVAAKIARWDVAGAVPSVPRYLAGNPLAMRRLASAETRKRPILTLVNHMGGTHNVPEQCFINRAAVVAAIADVIEASGYSLHIIGTSYCAKETFAHETAVTLKDPGAPVDIATLAFALGHAGFFRRIVLGVRCATDVNKPLGGGLGSTQDYSGALPPDTYLLPSMNTTSDYFLSEKTAATAGLAAMIATLARQGCPAFRDHENYAEAA